ncbi:unnamed protein product [Moneuplotes crassus]|uniref:Poly [ADP-ribose] polymerase n=1 Tax=Euplotes crassus TaxID=5936 RepID=A0AAD1UEZ8_EUPCR|nr:unnamed protein product [Moneuplotes crassus]
MKMSARMPKMKRSKDLRLLEFLGNSFPQEVKKKLDTENLYGNTPLVHCIKTKRFDIAKQIIDFKFYEEDRVDKYTRLTPLHHIAKVPDEGFIKVMISTFHSQINSKDYQGNTPLHYACWFRNRNYIELLVENGANVTLSNEEGNTPLHISCAGNNPQFDHSPKQEDYLINNGADVNAKNKFDETPLMMMFKLLGEDEVISSGVDSKFDPISTLMILLNNKADIHAKSKSLKTPLHYACIRGSTISALTLINNGAECNVTDYSDTTPYGYAMKNNHEDLCIFLIQQNKIIDLPINSIVNNPDHELNKLANLSSYVNSPEMDELIERKKALESKPTYEKLEEEYIKLQPYSPFYYAIRHNMQGNIYLLIQKGFSQFSALSECIMQNKFNLFLSILDIAEKNIIKERANEEGKNLLHIYCEHIQESQPDTQLALEILQIILDSGLNQYEVDKKGRIPLHYCYMRGNIFIANKLLGGKNNEEKIQILNICDHEQTTVFGMLFHNLSMGNSSNPLNQMVCNVVGEDTKKLNPFVKFRKEHFPYTQLSYCFEDGEMIHPVILMYDINQYIDPYLLSTFDPVGIVSPDSQFSLLCQLFKLGRISLLSLPMFKNSVEKYLQDDVSIKFIEETLSKPNKLGCYHNANRMKRFLLNQFRVEINVKSEVDDHMNFSSVKEKLRETFDYIEDSEKYLQVEIPRLQELSKSDQECVLDSTDKSEKHCYVVKDENETKFFYDAMMKKVDIKKYYYGLDNFYVLQLLYDPVKNIYIVWTRWGRSGSQGQYQRTPLKKEEAIKEFKRIFKQKTGVKWEEVKDYTRVPKKYDVKRLGGKLTSNTNKALKFSNADFDYTKLLIPWEKLETDIEMKNPEEFKYFIKPLTRDDHIIQNFTYSNFSRSLMVLAPQDKETVDDAIKLLYNMRKIIKESTNHTSQRNFEAYCACIEEIEKLNSEYLELIPKTNPTMISTLLHQHEVDAEIQRLKSIYSISSSVRSMLGAYLNKDEINPYDYILGTLNLNMSIIDLNSNETKLILHYLNSSRSNGYNLRNVVRIDDLEYTDEQNDRFENTPNHMMLWHGTGADNIINIMRNGLKIAPDEAFQHGSRYGKGLYFSDSFELSSCYSSESDCEKYILLCEVATGKMVNILSMMNQELKKTPNYDCIRVIPSTGPNWDGSVVKDDVVYPIGRTIHYPPPIFNALSNKRRSQRSSSRRSSRGQKVKDMGKYEIVEEGLESEESEEEEQKFIKPAFALGANTVPAVRKSDKMAKKNELMILEDNDDVVFPILPNQITAATRSDIKEYNKRLNNLHSYNHHSEYIIYNEALVRVKYIIQLSAKPKSKIKKEMNNGMMFKKKAHQWLQPNMEERNTRCNENK